MKHTNGPLNKLKYHVTGAIERGEKQAIEAITESKHTKGPWRISNDKDHLNVIKDSENKAICTNLGETSEEYENLNLIASAPELLEALELCNEFFVNNYKADDLTFWQDIKKAIKKAKGES